MITKIRRLGSSFGVIIPKSMRQEAGLEETAEIAFEKGAIVLRKPSHYPRQGWAEASGKLADAGDDKLVRPEFRNRDDRALQW